MKQRTSHLLVVVLAVMAVTLPAWAQEETKAQVKALEALHDTIVPLWHEAWPNKDMAQMKSLLPQVQQGVAEVAAAKLPGILRDKQSQWDAGVDALQQATKKYQMAAMTNNEEAMLAAVESVHSAFESLVRAIRPPMKELDAFHQVLYDIYHHDVPEKKLDALKEHAAMLPARCQALAAAPVPKRFAAKADALKPELDSLCRLCDKLVATTGGGDWNAIGDVVEIVHGQYQKIEATLE